MIKLTRTSGKAIWVDHRKIVSMFVEDTPNQATYVSFNSGNDLRVTESPGAIINLIKEWDRQ